MKIFKKIIGFCGNVLITSGEVGMVLFGLTYLCLISKFTIAFTIILVGIVTAVTRIKAKEKSEERDL